MNKDTPLIIALFLHLHHTSMADEIQSFWHERQFSGKNVMRKTFILSYNSSVGDQCFALVTL